MKPYPHLVFTVPDCNRRRALSERPRSWTASIESAPRNAPGIQCAPGTPVFQPASSPAGKSASRFVPWIVHAVGQATADKWKERLRAGFTLIELLVVLAMIAILAALLLPALAKAKSAAQTAKCKSNVRQIGLGLRMYVDQEGEFPPFHDCMARTGTNWWPSFLRPHTSSRWLDPLYKCPAYRGLTEEVNSCGIPGLGSYGINAQGLVGHNSVADKFLGLDGRTLHLHNNKTLALKEQIIRSPSEMIALGDANLMGYCAGFYGEGPSSAALRDGASASGPGELNFNQGRYILAQAGLANSGVPNRDVENFCRQAMRQRHNDRFNLGFADGHIDSLRTETLFSKRPEARSIWSNDNEPHPELFSGFGF
jgi:prepilin-type N-terminal cleavage/methylation domain-containing protein/prepilin-type processing-associated H-X9-DG protein